MVISIHLNFNLDSPESLRDPTPMKQHKAGRGGYAIQIMLTEQIRLTYWKPTAGWTKFGMSHIWVGWGMEPPQPNPLPIPTRHVCFTLSHIKDIKISTLCHLRILTPWPIDTTSNHSIPFSKWKLEQIDQPTLQVSNIHKNLSSSQLAITQMVYSIR